MIVILMVWKFESKFSFKQISTFQTSIAGMSGTLEFNDYGKRENFELQLMETLMGKELAKVRNELRLSYVSM